MAFDMQKINSSVTSQYSGCCSTPRLRSSNLTGARRSTAAGSGQSELTVWRLWSCFRGDEQDIDIFENNH